MPNKCQNKLQFALCTFQFNEHNVCQMYLIIIIHHSIWDNYLVEGWYLNISANKGRVL